MSERTVRRYAALSSRAAGVAGVSAARRCPQNGRVDPDATWRRIVGSPLPAGLPPLLRTGYAEISTQSSDAAPGW